MIQRDFERSEMVLVAIEIRDIKRVLVGYGRS